VHRRGGRPLVRRGFRRLPAGVGLGQPCGCRKPRSGERSGTAVVAPDRTISADRFAASMRSATRASASAEG
jgi:hypothetical protein